LPIHLCLLTLGRMTWKQASLPDQTSLDEGNFLGEDSKEWPTRKKEKTNKHYKPTCSSKV